MGHLHELLAAEKTALNARNQLLKETENKFGKGDNFFTGFTKTLKLHSDEPNNDKLEAAARQDKALPTTVVATLDYLLKFWASAEDLLFQKNLTNTKAIATLEFRGVPIKEGVPVDELMGLESRLGDLRALFTQIPTLDASREWEVDTQAAQSGTWRAIHPITTAKTEKTLKAFELAPATKEHKAQVEKLSEDKVIGTFTQDSRSGATTAIQKANVLAVLDELIIEVKKARTRANNVEVIPDQIGKILVDLIMGTLNNVPANNQA